MLKIVKVKRSVYIEKTNAGDVKQYILDAVEMGSGATLYEDPHILETFYEAGNAAAAAIGTAVTNYDNAPTTGNKNVIRNKITLGKNWLDLYSGKVETIANDDANRTTREEAFTNITLSYLTPQQLVFANKGTPDAPKISATNTGTGVIKTEILNGVDYKPTQTTFIVVEESALPVITIVDGQLVIELGEKGQVIVKAAVLKGAFTHLNF